MANPFQQRIRQRKFFYLVAIFALFTLSLLHREFTMRPLARSYQLTEDARGEVDLTSSVLCQVLTGSRGFAVAYLWNKTLDLQEKHQHEQVRLQVATLTKLQPFFITPWLFQSWNLAFNVAVECDRPRDKYFYISQGLELLAEGERRNRGLGNDDLGGDSERLKFPGNPDLRHFMGQIYQLKIGTSDEKAVMSCLLEMSCIDPVHRHPDRLRAVTASGATTIAPREFERLCRDYPRLIRRLRELNDPNKNRRTITPKEILDFLTDNFNIPSRYELPAGVSDPTQSLVKPWHQQFPLLPDPRERDRDGPDSQALTEEQFLKDEWVDAFVMARIWYQYAQKPLPPPFNPLDPNPFDPLKHRLPKGSSVIFRGVPARTQEYVAETLQKEGWFDGDGWLASAVFPKDSFPPTALDERREFRPGKGDGRYLSSRAWQKAYEMFKDFGVKNGLYYPREDLANLLRLVKQFEQEKGLDPGKEPLPLETRARNGDPLASAFIKFMWRNENSKNTGYEAHLAVCEAERTPLAVAARRRFHEADRLRRLGAEPEALALYEDAWPLWLQVMLEYPTFAQASQEETYEWHMRTMRTMQSQNEAIFKNAALGLAPLSLALQPDFKQVLWLKEASKQALIPNRTARSLLDWVQFVDFPHNARLKPSLLEWLMGSSAGIGAGWLPLLPHPGQANLLFTRQVAHATELPLGWANLVDSGQVEPVRQRLGWRTLPMPTPESMGMPQK